MELLVEGVEEAIVVVPNWPGRVWYNLLLEIACETLVRFKTSLDLLSQSLPKSGDVVSPRFEKACLNSLAVEHGSWGRVCFRGH